MALYEFKCDECGRINTESLPISSKKKETTCSFCDGVAKKIISKNNFILKGDKWASKKGY